eukprot:Platyproteum_vivax@DN10372_c0_g1_i1.p2
MRSQKMMCTICVVLGQAGVVGAVKHSAELLRKIEASDMHQLALKNFLGSEEVLRNSNRALDEVYAETHELPAKFDCPESAELAKLLNEVIRLRRSANKAFQSKAEGAHSVEEEMFSLFGETARLKAAHSGEQESSYEYY